VGYSADYIGQINRTGGLPCSCLWLGPKKRGSILGLSVTGSRL
jgi:hypothetical protein